MNHNELANIARELVEHGNDAAAARWWIKAANEADRLCYWATARQYRLDAGYAATRVKVRNGEELH